jgi:hypothetical protein
LNVFIFLKFSINVIHVVTKQKQLFIMSIINELNKD